MTNELIITKLKQRLDKADSSDYGNLETWMYIEAFNKEQVNWVRRQLEGINQTRTGAEATTRRIDDLQFILVTNPIVMTDKGIYWSASLPTDYIQFNRVSTMGINDCCPPRPITIYESVEADRDVNLTDSGKQPTFDWATTFCTVSNKQVNVYTNNLFDLQNTTLTYYRTPASIEIAGVANPVTGLISTADVLSEAADNIIEVIIDGAAAILARDIQNYQLSQLSQQSAQQNT